MQKEWRILDTDSNEKSLIKRLLFSRGIKSDEDIYEFLHPLETKLTNPNLFCDMDKTIKRLADAINNKETIIIYGDFDADGVTSTSLLYKTFKHLNADVHYFIPNRDTQGHGFDKQALVTLMTTVKPKIIISVDCGISDIDAVNFLNSFKIDVIITDHHEAPEVLPNAFSIINPKAPNALNENLSVKNIESLTSLAGVGVAFKVAQGLLEFFNKTEFIYEILPLVAIGTVGDIVPLIGENRYFVTKGIELIKNGNSYGITKLLESAGCNIANLTAENIAFGLVPRINASGRLDTVSDALKVFISNNKQEIDMAIISLNELNKLRQELCQNTFLEAEEMFKKEGNKNPAIILANSSWHVGIIGIVASKFVEKYYKPAFLMTYSQEENKYKCSARGIDGLSLYDIINENSENLDGFGGHKLAAGLTFSADKVSFEKIKSGLNNSIKEMLNGKVLKPFVNIDLELYPTDITEEFINEISQLEPFGAANPSPIFVLKNLKIKQKRLMGENQEHLRLTLQSGTCEFTCIRWQMGDIALVVGDTLDIAFHPQINLYNGEKYIQLIIDDVHSPYLEEKEPNASEIKLFDHRKKTDILPLVNDYVKKSSDKIMIFAESKNVKDKLIPYKDLTDRIFTRENLETCDSLMFFDYPADKETFDKIIEETKPSAIHFMKYDIKYFDEKDFIITFEKMLRYAVNNNNGKVDLLRCSSALGKSYETILTLFDLFEDVGFITIIERNFKFYKIELNNIDDISKILHNEKYNELKILINECEDFQKKLMENDLTTLELNIG